MPRRVEPVREFEPALPAEVDIEQHDVRANLGSTPCGFGSGGGHFDFDPIVFEQRSSRPAEAGAVINQETSHRHTSSMAAVFRAHITASPNMLCYG